MRNQNHTAAHRNRYAAAFSQPKQDAFPFILSITWQYFHIVSIWFREDYYQIRRRVLPVFVRERGLVWPKRRLFVDGLRTITDLKIQCVSSLNLRGKQIKGWHVHAETENNVQCETIKKPDSTGVFGMIARLAGFRPLKLVAAFFDLNHVQNGKQNGASEIRLFISESQTDIPNLAI